MSGNFLALRKFGKILNSRPAGQEALMRAKQLIKGSTEDTIILDVTSVDVLIPSFADEFINGLKNLYTGEKSRNSGSRRKSPYSGNVEGTTIDKWSLTMIYS